MDNMRQIIYGAIAIIIGLVLLPLVAAFIQAATVNVSVGRIPGLTSVLNIIGYCFAFGLIGVGVGMIWHSYKND